MHTYRLTRRGKFILTIFVMLISLAGTLSLKAIGVPSNKFEYSVNDSEQLWTKSGFYELDLRKIAIEYGNEMMKLNEESVKEEFKSIDVEDIKTYDGSKLAFLTFDDGPSKNVTPEVLNILDSYNIKATFFVLGNMCEKNGIVLQRIAEEGHSIGIHSYSHRLNELLANEDSFINELCMTENALKDYLGIDFKTRLFRFPGGSFENYKKQYMDVLNEHGYISVDWNALTGDTEHVNPTPDMLLNRLKATIINKNHIVVLMHDSETKHVTVEVLPDVIEYLKSEGYEFAILK